VVVLVAVAPLAAYVPLAVMAALLFVVAWGLVDIAEMRRIVRARSGESWVLALTFLATLTIELQFAIFVGVLASLFVYLNRTTHPRLTPVVPDPTGAHRRFVPVADAQGPAVAECPQLALLRVDGSLFFGAAEHVRDEIHAARSAVPHRHHLLLIGSGINFIDVAGCQLLVHEARVSRDTGGALYLCNLKPAVRDVLRRGGFLDEFGRNCVFATKDEAIRQIYARLDSARCRVCEVRIFNECAAVLPDGSARPA
jgi:SulP family sulfate permease